MLLELVNLQNLWDLQGKADEALIRRTLERQNSKEQ